MNGFVGQLQQVRDLAWCYRQKHAFLDSNVDALTLNVAGSGERDFNEVMKVKGHRVRF